MCDNDFRLFDEVPLEDHTDYDAHDREVAAWNAYFASYWHRRLWRWVTGLWRRGR